MVNEIVMITDKQRAYKQAWYQRNRERILTERRAKYAADPDVRRRANKESYERNKSARLRAQKIRRSDPAVRAREYAANHKRNSKRMKRDLNFRLACAIRSRVGNALRASVKDGRAPNKTSSSVANLSCSMDEFKAHIESLFQPGMSWDNWAQRGWHLDHIVPLSSFDLEDPEQYKKATHYTNYQPLWWQDNHKKYNKLSV